MANANSTVRSPLGGLCCVDAVGAAPCLAARSRHDKTAVQRKGSGLPIPRFATLKSDEVNVRTGPGPRYPIDWVFKRKGMPVEIVAEYENFRKIRDWQGASGWVYQGLLTGKRSFIIPAKTANLYKTPATLGRGGRQARARGDGRDPLVPGRLVPGEGPGSAAGWSGPRSGASISPSRSTSPSPLRGFGGPVVFASLTPPEAAWQRRVAGGRRGRIVKRVTVAHDLSLT